MCSSETINIAASTQKLDVDNRIALRFYYRIADNILKQVFLLCTNQFLDFVTFHLLFVSIYRKRMGANIDRVRCDITIFTG